MLTVPTSLKPSPISGIGCFAEVKIKLGATVWIMDPRLDDRYDFDDIHTTNISNFPQCFRDEVKLRGYINPIRLKTIILCGDNARFMNFDLPASVGFGRVIHGENILVALRDIEPGEELTVPVESDADAVRKLASI